MAAINGLLDLLDGLMVARITHFLAEDACYALRSTCARARNLVCKDQFEAFSSILGGIEALSARQIERVAKRIEAARVRKALAEDYLAIAREISERGYALRPWTVGDRDYADRFLPANVRHLTLTMNVIITQHFGEVFEPPTIEPHEHKNHGLEWIKFLNFDDPQLRRAQTCHPEFRDADRLRVVHRQQLLHEVHPPLPQETSRDALLHWTLYFAQRAVPPIPGLTFIIVYGGENEYNDSHTIVRDEKRDVVFYRVCDDGVHYNEIHKSDFKMFERKIISRAYGRMGPQCDIRATHDEHWQETHFVFVLNDRFRQVRKQYKQIAHARKPSKYLRKKPRRRGTTTIIDDVSDEDTADPV